MQSDLQASIKRVGISVYSFELLRQKAFFDNLLYPRNWMSILELPGTYEALEDFEKDDEKDIWFESFLIWSSYLLSKFALKKKVNDITAQEKRWLKAALAALLQVDEHTRVWKSNLWDKRTINLVNEFLRSKTYTLKATYSNEKALPLLYHDLSVLTFLDLVANRYPLSGIPTIKALIWRCMIDAPPYLHQLLLESLHDNKPLNFPALLVAMSGWIHGVIKTEDLAQRLRYGVSVSPAMAANIGSVLGEHAGSLPSNLDTIVHEWLLPEELTRAWYFSNNKQNYKLKLIPSTNEEMEVMEASKYLDNTISAEEHTQLMKLFVSLSFLDQFKELVPIDPDVYAIVGFLGCIDCLTVDVIKSNGYFPEALFSSTKGHIQLRAVIYAWLQSVAKETYKNEVDTDTIWVPFVHTPQIGYFLRVFRVNTMYERYTMVTRIDEIPRFIVDTNEYNRDANCEEVLYDEVWRHNNTESATRDAAINILPRAKRLHDARNTQPCSLYIASYKKVAGGRYSAIYKLVNYYTIQESEIKKLKNTYGMTL